MKCKQHLQFHFSITKQEKATLIRLKYHLPQQYDDNGQALIGQLKPS